MNRRELFYSLLGVSSLPAFLQAQSASSPAAQALTFSVPEAVGSSAPRFFGPAAYAAFSRLGELLMPEGEEEPGARGAGAPAFLDFLLSESPAELQKLYRDGVASLDRQARTKSRKSFAELSETEAGAILEPLNAPWTYSGPSDPFAQFLQASKMAFWQATRNSRPWAEAMSERQRGAAGINTYWLAAE